MGRRPYLAGGGGEGWQVLGSWVEHHQGPRTVGGGAAEHVEAHPARSALVSRRQPAPVAPLLLVSGSSAQGADGTNPDPRLRAPESAPSDVAPSSRRQPTNSL